jgi:hypothetical protein
MLPTDRGGRGSSSHEFPGENVSLTIKQLENDRPRSIPLQPRFIHLVRFIWSVMKLRLCQRILGRPRDSRCPGSGHRARACEESFHCGFLRRISAPLRSGFLVQRECE